MNISDDNEKSIKEEITEILTAIFVIKYLRQI